MSDRRHLIGPILGVVGGFVVLVYAVLELWIAYNVSGLLSLNALPVTGTGGSLTGARSGSCAAF